MGIVLYEITILRFWNSNKNKFIVDVILYCVLKDQQPKQTLLLLELKVNGNLHRGRLRGQVLN